MIYQDFCTEPNDSTSESADGLDDDLDSYETSGSNLSQYRRGLVDYEDQLLYSTWNASFQQV